MMDLYSADTLISISSSADCSPSIPRLNTDPLRPDRGALKVTVPPGLYEPAVFRGATSHPTGRGIRVVTGFTVIGSAGKSTRIRNIGDHSNDVSWCLANAGALFVN